MNSDADSALTFGLRGVCLKVINEGLLTKNYNILDSIQVVKKHPYITAGVICLFLNFLTRQESERVVSPLLLVCLFLFVSVVTLNYMLKTKEDFVLSQRGMLLTVPIFACIFICGTVFNIKGKGIFWGSVCFLFVVLGLFLLLKYTGRLTLQNSLLLIFITGFAVRTVYAMYTPIAEMSVRQHDVSQFITQTSPGLITKFSNYRHSEYIEYIARYLKLPDVDPSVGLSQLYHPPLHHILCGLLLKLNMKIGMDYKSACEGIQYLTVFYSSSCMITGYKIFKELGLDGKSLLRSVALFSFFPWFYVFAGGVNNDILSVALCFAAILLVIKWYKSPTMKKALHLAIVFGLAMFTKLSVILLLPAILFVFVAKWFSVRKDEENTFGIGKLVKSLASFIGVALPLGLWWQIKNKILFGVPFSYAPSLLKTDSQYVGERSVLERLFGVEDTIFQNPFVAWENKNAGLSEYNIFSGGFKTALFDETALFAKGGETPWDVIISTIGSFFCIMLEVFFALLIILSVISLFVFLRKKCLKMDKCLFSTVAIVFVTFFVSYVCLCFRYPFTSTMNFRHTVMCLILPILVFSAVTGCEQKNKAFGVISSVATKGFCICGVASYVMLSLV